MTEQDKFHYSLPEDDGPRGWDGLSLAAREAMAAGAIGPNSAERLVPESGESASKLHPAAREAAASQINRALDSWRQYKNLIHVPESFEEFMELSPYHEERLELLCKANDAICNTGATTPEGNDLGGSMDLVLIPWADFEQARTRLFTYIARWRVDQGTPGYDRLDDHLGRTIEDDRPIYRSPMLPRMPLRPSEYIQNRIKNNGPWGIMLAQTSREAGVKDDKIENRSADELTDNGARHLRFAGHNVDAMGIFEWLSLTLQEDPGKISTRDRSMLLANRVRKETPFDVPVGYWEGEVQGCAVDLRDPTDADPDIRPRLAVTTEGLIK